MLATIGTQKYNMATMPAIGADISGAANGAVTTNNSHTTSLTTDNPMLWLLGLGAVTMGLVAFSTHVRVGKFSASVSGG